MAQSVDDIEDEVYYALAEELEVPLEAQTSLEYVHLFRSIRSTWPKVRADLSEGSRHLTAVEAQFVSSLLRNGAGEALERYMADPTPDHERLLMLHTLKVDIGDGMPRLPFGQLSPEYQVAYRAKERLSAHIEALEARLR